MSSFKHHGRQYLRQAKDSFFHLNFYRVHLLYFISTIILSSGILYGSSTSGFKLSYIDAISLITSAMCNVGLNTVNLGSLNGFQQAVLFVLMLMGDLTLVTISVVIVRRYFFSKRIDSLVQNTQAGRQIAEDIETQQSRSAGHSPQNVRKRHGSFEDDRHKSYQAEHLPLNQSHFRGYGSFPAPWHTDYFRRAWDSMAGTSGDTEAEHHYLSFQPQLDHKGRFTALNAQQMDELGGVEYRALRLLTWLLPSYTAFWIFGVMVVLAPYAAETQSSVIHNAQPGNLSPAWWAVFQTVSSYTNTGLSLLNQNMIPFARNYLILIFTGAAIFGGNTLYPVFLRLSIWSLSKCVRRTSELHHSLSFLLQHPRRCYLLLFPSTNTWILFGVQMAITLVAWVFWIILQLDQASINPGIPPGQRIMDGLFQSLGLRASGMYIIPTSELSPALQFFYMITMYISAFPIIMSLRGTNVYEERSLGQDDSSKLGVDQQNSGSKPKSQIGVHIRKQFAYDIWWLVAAILLICIIEHNRLNTHAPGFSIFSVIFEVISGYGTVGLSLGVPYADYSLCGTWHVLSKLVLLTVMLRGRHRILPMAVDRAVMVPGQELMEKLDKEPGATHGRRWQQIESRIRGDERGEQVERRGSNQQDPE